MNLAVVFLNLIAFSAVISLAAGNGIIPRSDSVTFKGPIAVEANGMTNIHITYNAPIDGELSIHYGDCSAPLQHPKNLHHHRVGATAVGSHPSAKRHMQWKDRRPERFVWLIPEDAPDQKCLFAYAGDYLVGRSDAVVVKKRNVRRGVAFADVVDSEGPWFDGVQYLKEKEPDEIFVTETKSKEIGIVGAGMAGLLCSLLLTSAGLHHWKIIEASDRLGGRVHTSYLNGSRPDEYQYQELGPMRFPVSITYADTNETLQIKDHRMVFQLADKLNHMNGNHSKYIVKFIEWIQNSDNAPYPTSKRLPKGTVPGFALVAANPALQDNITATYSNATAVAEAEAAYDSWHKVDRAQVKAMATNIFAAHKKAIEDGWLDYSEWGYLRYRLGLDLNITDEVYSINYVADSWPYDDVYFAATEWRTIDQGLSRLPQAFGPSVLNRTIFNSTVQELFYNDTSKKISVNWRPNNLFSKKPKSIDFDYVVVAVPFSRVRLWRLPQYTSLLSRAINTLYYDQSCKVALHYKTRFWEHLEYPIIGGCGATDIPGIGSICYPSYKINSSGPGAILASYIYSSPARAISSFSDEEHAAYVQRAMVEVHGQIADDQYTGVHDRMCWENNELQSGAWCSPLPAQQNLYLPAYFHTEMKTVFIGEHTSYTHAWIWSALESAVRGTTQLLLDMGLVDEAKAVTTEWMARWMKM